jgi:hypothetical protein
MPVDLLSVSLMLRLSRKHRQDNKCSVTCVRICTTDIELPDERCDRGCNANYCVGGIVASDRAKDLELSEEASQGKKHT